MGEPKIVVVDYHKGNLSSVVRGLARAGAAAARRTIRSRSAMPTAWSSGVGAFYDAIAFMRQSGEADAVLDASPPELRCSASAWAFSYFLSAATRACLRTRGCRDGNASERADGPGSMAWHMCGSCTRLESSRLKVPHVGWDQVHMTLPVRPIRCCRFCRGCQQYFTHSYVVADDADAADVFGAHAPTRGASRASCAMATCGAASSIRESSALGQRILKNFVSIVEGPADDSVSAIDLIGGKVVRPERGDRSRCKYIPTTRGRCPLLCRAGARAGCTSSTCPLPLARTRTRALLTRRRSRPSVASTVCPWTWAAAFARLHVSTSWPATVLAASHWARCS